MQADFDTIPRRTSTAFLILCSSLLAAACQTSDVSNPVVPADQAYPEIRAGYELVDLTRAVDSSASFVSLTKSGSVGGTINGEGFIWARGTVAPLPGCVRLASVNSNGTAACWLGDGYGVWSKGETTPIPELAGAYATLHVNEAGVITGSFSTSGCTNCSFNYATKAFTVVSRAGYGDLFIDVAGDSLFEGPHGAYYRTPYVLALASGARYTFDTGLGEVGAGLGLAGAMNDSGWVVGASEPHHSTPSAFLMKDGVTTKLGDGSAASINNRGQIVGDLVADPGRPYPFSGPSGPFLWETGTARLLTHAATDPAWVITHARQINDAGQILATADDSSARFYNHTVLPTPHT